MKNTSSNTDQVLEQYREISILESSASVLYWDMETMMPKGSSNLRGEQLGTLSKLIHEKRTAPKFVEQIMSLNTEDSPHVKKLQLLTHKSVAVSPVLVERLAKLQVEGQALWKKAREESNYSLVQSKLQALLDAQIEYTQSLKTGSEFLKKYYKDFSNYDVNLDQFEPGMKASQIRGMLDELGKALKEILPQATAKANSRKEVDASKIKMSISKQEELNKKIAATLGYDFQQGRLDVSTHPFCGGSPGDTRITTRYDENDFVDSLSSVIHETGHALYEQGLPAQLIHKPCGAAASFGVHESQSRLYENQVARSRPFCEYLSTLVSGISVDELYTHMTRIKEGFIRVDADEVSYNLHIILRMGIEERLLNGTLHTKDLPSIWNSEFEHLFGRKVPNDKMGCLQDTHWYGGGFGYFPTYSIGNVLAAQLFQKYTKENSSWESDMRKGDFAKLRAFLSTRVHEQAALSDSPSTIQKALDGDTLNAKTFIEYIKGKYL